jgi:hypothetical protein
MVQPCGSVLTARPAGCPNGSAPSVSSTSDDKPSASTATRHSSELARAHRPNVLAHVHLLVLDDVAGQSAPLCREYQVAVVVPVVPVLVDAVVVAAVVAVLAVVAARVVVVVGASVSRSQRTQRLTSVSRASAVLPSSVLKRRVAPDER